MPLLSRKRLLLAKLETTVGTDPTPTVGSDAIEVRNIDVTPLEVDTVSRELIRPFLGQAEQLLSQQRVSINFEVELAGSGSAGTAPAYGPLLQACRCTETVVSSTSVTYAPNSDATPKSVTIYFNNDGVLHKITGSRGTFSLSAEVGAVPFISFQMTGVYNAPSDVAISSPTYADQADPLVFKNGNSSSFQVFSYSGAVQSVSFDVNNTVVYRELVGGTKSIEVTDRAPAGECVIEATTIATKDFFTAATETSTGNLTFQHGSTAGNIVTFTAAQIDLGGPSYSDQDGIQMLTLPYIATPTSAGNNEFSLVMT
jgi:hypothetical protein|tara:strand:- start:134 stop:1072 length:939 start_codon:yes stop_codon:yes gene_type:complete